MFITRIGNQLRELLKLMIQVPIQMDLNGKVFLGKRAKSASIPGRANTPKRTINLDLQNTLILNPVTRSLIHNAHSGKILGFCKISHLKITH
jgi:hypothetical protein